MVHRESPLQPFPATKHHKASAGKHPGECAARHTITCVPRSCGPSSRSFQSSSAHTRLLCWAMCVFWPCAYRHMCYIRTVGEEGQPEKKNLKMVFLTLYERVFIPFQSFRRVASHGEPSVSFRPVSPSSGGRGKERLRREELGEEIVTRDGPLRVPLCHAS